MLVNPPDQDALVSDFADQEEQEQESPTSDDSEVQTAPTDACPTEQSAEPTEAPPDDRGAEQYQKAVSELYKLFSFLNHAVFNDEIWKPVISIQVGKKGPKQACWCSYQQVWRTKEDTCPQYFEICYHAELLDRSAQEIAKDMVHQMVHIWNAQHGLKDNCRCGTYHNKRFKATAEEHGLVCDSSDSKKYGFAEVYPPAPLMQEILQHMDCSAFSIIREEPVAEAKPKEKKPPTPVDDFKERFHDAIKTRFKNIGDATALDIAKFAVEVSRTITEEELSKKADDELSSGTNAAELRNDINTIASDISKTDSDSMPIQEEPSSGAVGKPHISAPELVSIITKEFDMLRVQCPTCSATAFVERGGTVVCAACMEEMMPVEE